MWTPDGRFVLFQSVLTGGIFWMRSDGGNKPQLLIQSKNLQYPWSMTANGKRLAFIELSENAYDIWTVPIESAGDGLKAGKPELFLQTSADERQPSISPDGQWLAYASNSSGKYQVYVRRFPDNGSLRQVSNDGGAYPVWSPRSNELFFRTEDNQVMVASYTASADSFSYTRPRVWTEKRIAGPLRNFALASDGKRIAALMPVETAANRTNQNHVIFLENFFDEVRRRASGSNTRK
jgi:serine/threonine-protein kinase